MSIHLLRSAGCPEWVMEHSLAVRKKALELAENLPVNIELVEEGALLHDIGRCRTSGVEHAVEGARILRELGYPVEVIRIVERHVGAGIPGDEADALGLPPGNYMPETLEEKIVAHADNLINGSDEVDIDFVIKKWSDRLGKNHPSIDRLRKLHEELMEMSR
ncbi:TIGR00295 family protein [Methanothermobacter sp. K4]|uniref:TIGR00295 family protein n=1 Tax=Methanothermobacter sp. K4 TaxID=2913262 RepID=UPI001EDA9D77|nr:TIGR00295 family protein [Methanothermobacter sp. K4]MCG2827671.1 TIGR00295 family protein [Methanothermobacter sp. K4]